MNFDQREKVSPVRIVGGFPDSVALLNRWLKLDNQQHRPLC